MTDANPERLFSAEDWARFLTRSLGREVQVRYGSARRQVIVVHPLRSGLRVRMNGAFRAAPVPVRSAVLDWLRVGRRAPEACRELDAWIASMVRDLGPPPVPRLVTRGQHHDLAALAAELLEHEFRALPAPRRPRGVTWGRRGRRSASRSLQLGSFDPETRVVRIHPALDQPAVPRWFVRYVLFHEFLHAELDVACREGQRASHHGPAFRRRENDYPGTAPALAWQDEHIGALLRSARTGKPMSARRGRAPRVSRVLQALLFD